MAIAAHAHRQFQGADRRTDDPNLFDGTPVAVQVVCRRLQEEKCLAIAEYVANALSQARRDAAKL